LFDVIFLFNSDGYHINPVPPSGFAGGDGDRTGTPHAADYKSIGQSNPAEFTADFIIDSDELFDVIFLFNSDGYHVNSATPSGYAGGPAQ
jgi:hypothetical protein